MPTDIHGGNWSAIISHHNLSGPFKQVSDFSVNLNLLGPPPKVRRYFERVNSDFIQYPTADCTDAEKHLANQLGLPATRLVMGNGSTDLLHILLYELNPSRVFIPDPTYSGYAKACGSTGFSNIRYISTSESQYFKPDLSDIALKAGDLCILCSPNNPTGITLSKSDIQGLAKSNKQATILLDESFMDFCPDKQTYSFLTEQIPENVVVLRSLTKQFAIAGLRLGFVYCCSALADRLRARRPEWSVNALAGKVAHWLYEDTEYINKSKIETESCRNRLIQSLNNIHQLHCIPSSANFVLVRCGEGLTGQQLQKYMLKFGILIRAYAHESPLRHYFRLAVKEPVVTDTLIVRLKKCLSEIHSLKSLHGI